MKIVDPAKPSGKSGEMEQSWLSIKTESKRKTARPWEFAVPGLVPPG
jgi:hypothetical protein